MWLCPFERPEVDEVVARAGGTRPPRGRGRARPPTRWRRGTWPRLATSYAAWPDLADSLVRGEPDDPSDEDESAFAARFRLVHEWRKFLFDDPGLPAELLPRDWPGQAAADLFTSEAARLKPASDRFVARCLGVRESLRA